MCEFNGIEYRTKKEALSYVRQQLKNYGCGEYKKGSQEYDFLMELVRRRDDYEYRIERGINNMIIRRDLSGKYYETCIE